MREGWERKKLGDTCKIFNGNSINAAYKKAHYEGLSYGYPYIATKDVSFSGVITYENGVKIPFDEGLKVAKPNSVFICVEGGSAGRKIGYVEQEVCFGNKLFCLEPGKNISGAFLYYYLRSDAFQNQFAEKLTGLIGGVSAKKFCDITVVYPSHSEQQEIVDYLDSAFAKIDAMKANAEKALEEGKAFFQSALKQMLEPKEGWEDKKLVDIVDKNSAISYGIVQPGDNVSGGVPVVRPVDLIQKVVFLHDGIKRTSKENSNSYKRTLLNGKEILMCVRGSTGVVSLTDSSLVGSNVTRGIVPIKIEDEFLRLFTYYSIIAPVASEFIQTNTRGAALKQINIADVKLIPISIPSKEVQQEIVTTLDSIKSKVDQLQENYDKIAKECDTLKQAILRQVFE